MEGDQCSPCDLWNSQLSYCRLSTAVIEMKRGVKKGGRGNGGTGIQYRVLMANSMQIYCPVCLEVLTAEDRKTRDRRGRNRLVERESGTATEWK